MYLCSNCIRLKFDLYWTHVQLMFDSCSTHIRLMFNLCLTHFFSYVLPFGTAQDCCILLKRKCSKEFVPPIKIATPPSATMDCKTSTLTLPSLTPKPMNFAWSSPGSLMESTILSSSSTPVIRNESLQLKIPSIMNPFSNDSFSKESLHC